MSGRVLMAYSSFFWGAAALLTALAAAARRLARRRPGPWRSRLLNGALVLGALLLPLVAAEGFFLFFVDTTDGALATLTSRRWRERHLTPGVEFRGRSSRSEESLADSGRFIEVVGDSITFGQGVARDEDLYPSLLERELRARGAAADVVNISHPGWNIPEELIALRKQYEAGHVFDVVVLGFCLNDLGAYVPPAPGFKQAVERLGAPPAPLAPLVSRSFVASYLFFRYVYATSRPIKETAAAMAAGYRSDWVFAALTNDLDALRRLVESHGGRLAVLTFPDTSGPWERYAYRDFHRKLGAYWASVGVTHVDLLPVYERHPPGNLRVSFMDSHPNERAHRLAAAALAEALAGLLGLPAATAAIPAAGT